MQCFQKLPNRESSAFLRTHQHMLPVCHSQVALRIKAGTEIESAWIGLKIFLSPTPLINSELHPASLGPCETVQKQTLEELALQNGGKRRHQVAFPQLRRTSLYTKLPLCYSCPTPRKYESWYPFFSRSKGLCVLLHCSLLYPLIRRRLFHS